MGTGREHPLYTQAPSLSAEKMSYRVGSRSTRGNSTVRIAVSSTFIFLQCFFNKLCLDYIYYIFYDTNLYMVLLFFLIFYNEIIMFEDRTHKKYFNKRYVL